MSKTTFGAQAKTRLDPDRASPVLLLLNRNLYKWRIICRVWCVDFHYEGAFIGVNGTSTDLERSVWHQVVAGRPSHMAHRPGEQPPLTFSTDSSFSSSCRRVATKALAEPPQTLAGWPRSWADRLALGPTRPMV
jgi:hypothetical protein